NPSSNPQHHVLFQPLLKALASFGLAQQQSDKTATKLANGYCADKKRWVWLRTDPCCHARIRPKLDGLGRDVRVQQETAHRSSGRAVEGFRLKSMSSARPRTGSHNSTKFFRRNASTSGDVIAAF